MIPFQSYVHTAPGRDEALAKLAALVLKHDPNADITNRPSGPMLPAKQVFPHHQHKLSFGWGDICKTLGIWDGNKITERVVPRDSIQDVPVKQLVATQPTVWADTIEKYLKQPPAAWSTSETPLFVLRNGKYYVFDGHHRLAASILLKRPTVTGQVVPL